jgi:ASC-1-like (ASCH) protein
MIHEMRLDPQPFDEIYARMKKVELRLNDEKRQQISIGDVIKFYKRPEMISEMDVNVTGLHKYKTIRDMVEATPLENFGPRFQNKHQLLNMSFPYTQEEINKYGFLVIDIERI